MDSFLSLVLFGALFYAMMRFGGCGAHMMGGHRGQGHTDRQGDGHSTRPASTSVDPVCGMTVPPDTGYAIAHAGRQYRFCSRACLDKFEATPRQDAA